MALRGKSFCNAAKDGFEIVWSNPLRYMIVGGVGWIMMFLGKLMIAASTTALFYIIITYVSSIKANIIEPIYLLIVNIMLFSLFSSWPLQLDFSSCLYTALLWTQLCNVSSLIRQISKVKVERQLFMPLNRSKHLSIWMMNDYSLP